MLRLKLLLVVTLSFFSTVSTSDPNFGDSTSYITSRIVGGEPADIENYPYQVSFTSNVGLCGGFIISENYILTAAHCVRNLDQSTVVLRAGSSWRKNGTIIPIAEVTSHPEYNTPTFGNNDVAVLKTVDPIQFTDDIESINLPEKNRPLLENSIVKVSGWGKTEQGSNTLPERLMDVEIPVLSGATCWSVYSLVWTENMWCGGDFELGGKGTCVGDSGGAAVQDDLAVGIVSFGRGCGKPFAPSIFANIAAPSIRDFIKEQTGL